MIPPQGVAPPPITAADKEDIAKRVWDRLLTDITEPDSIGVNLKTKVDIKVSDAKIPEVFGDGIDGNVTISADTTLSADKQYNRLTVDSGVTLKTGGYIIRVKEWAKVHGIITDDFRGTGGSAAQDAAGGDGQIVSVTTSLGTFTIGRTGGGGGDGRGPDTHRSIPGAGGRCGGLVILFARFLLGGGSIKADGEDGEDGICSPDHWRTGGSGGGGGGSGGLIWVIYRTLSPALTFSANAGAAGGRCTAGVSGYTGDGTYTGLDGGDAPAVIRDFGSPLPLASGGAGSATSGVEGEPGSRGSGGGGGYYSAGSGTLGGVGGDGDPGVIVKQAI